ncbi:Sulfate adenylyltransferase, small subunit [Parvularcula bermudensis HTCC2503]|uniref:Sulfate adenylyltransferase subunit 2 n=1 Tax=Parvularcula bermudensis (strain ATCC BAA-594 / HTCC2503 / KCTC 12087) TaxID=314260 RepID=E0THE9_PARBH|nr:sulfate adenylyltransferase subunit CysD [Parvularcula bermudensis]ADM10741.1 Sulfate adenylyltransferase, small subunit [Parvularcula bermudensis HTCC2503]
MKLSRHLIELESEAIHILRDGVAESENPVLLFSAGKDSTVLAHLALRAFYPSPPPLPLLHIDSTWEFGDLLQFRDNFAAEHGFNLIVYANEEGRRQGLNPFDHDKLYTTRMRTDALKAALDQGGYDVIFGGARRDEEATRAKERIVSVRGPGHSWEPRRQRPELWTHFNWTRAPGETLRAFPISNWTERDLWTYIIARNINLAPLYYAAERQVVERDGTLIVVDEPDRMRWLPGETSRPQIVRFRTLGCWPVTGAVSSSAKNAGQVAYENLTVNLSERQGRVSDAGSLEAQKREGYF